jgi:hypothetical protein
MAYSTANPPRLLVPRVGTGTALWVYSSTDTHTDVDAANYFTNGFDLGMRTNDVVIVLDTDAPSATIHMVTESSADGATISVATLA